MEKVVAVLRSGGIYKPEHVYKLRDGVEKHLGWDFVCLSDVELDCDTIPLCHNWPGWWSKFEIFSLTGPTLYFDLDTILVGDCRGWAEKAVNEDFCILRDRYRGRKNPQAMGSGIMAWRDDVFYIYEHFLQYRNMSHPLGDQGIVEQAVKKATFLQDLTDSVVSYKADILEGYPLEKASVVYFHGEPRPWSQNSIPY